MASDDLEWEVKPRGDVSFTVKKLNNFKNLSLSKPITSILGNLVETGSRRNSTIMKKINLVINKKCKSINLSFQLL